MSNIFTRTLYDPENMELKDVARRNKGDYMLNLIGSENANLCYSSSGMRNGVSELSRPTNQEGFLNFSAKADIENKLQNRHLPLGSLERTNKDYVSNNVAPASNCESFQEQLTLEDTRLSHPVSDFREMRTDQYNFVPFLHVNPQNVTVTNDMWHRANDRSGVSTRTVSKEEIAAKRNEKVDFVKLHSDLLPKRN